MANKYSSAAENGVIEPFRKLLAYCRQNDWAGYDPYDALNSELLRSFPILNSRIPRILVTQALKMSPVNLRGLLGIPKTQNPKALALFLSSFVSLSSEQVPDRKDLINGMIRLIAAKRSPGIVSYWCWGYSFPWQTRKEVVPAGAPNLVCTTFVASALLDAYEHTGDPTSLEMAVSAAEYIVDKLYWTGNSVASFSYPQPGVPSQTHNANFLAADLLCRVYKHTAEEKFLGPAMSVARCSVSKQNADGSWKYGEVQSQEWIDNFHSGYNLCALQSIGRSLETVEFDSSVRRGFAFYRDHFFREDGAARYFHNRTYPIDIHCVAQGIITLLALKELDGGSVPLAHSVLQFALDQMWDDRGFFYYRVLPVGKIRTPYMRWSQGWMLLAMTRLLCDREAAPGSRLRDQPTVSSSHELATETEARG
jgi:hypothetical protein